MSNAVQASAVQASNTFQPVFTRTIASRPSGALLGFWTGSTTFLGTDDPLVSFGYVGATGEVQSTFALEGDWKTAFGNITEIYWQIVKTDGTTSRRPVYSQYDRGLQRATFWNFLIGNGITDTGAANAKFSVNWDDDTGPTGVNCFSVTPNRINLYAVNTGGISSDNTLIRMYSDANKGSGINFTYNGTDPENDACCLRIRTTSAGASAMYSRNRRLFQFADDGTNPQIGFLGASAAGRQTVTGSRGSNAALASLLTALATLGLITDSSS